MDKEGGGEGENGRGGDQVVSSLLMASLLFDGHAFGEVTWAVDVTAAEDGDMISE